VIVQVIFWHFLDYYNWLAFVFSKLSIWFVSLLKKGAFIGCLVGMKLELGLIFGVIIQFFVCGSEFRARWDNETKDS
jgi:hypothetical protein